MLPGHHSGEAAAGFFAVFEAHPFDAVQERLFERREDEAKKALPAMFGFSGATPTAPRPEDARELAQASHEAFFASLGRGVGVLS